MKILYIITKGEYGGAQTHVFQLAQYMAGKGNEVAVMSHPKGEKRKEIQNSKFQIPNKFQIQNSKQKRNEIRFYPNPYFKNSYNPFLGLKAMKEVRKAVDDFKPGLVSCHSTVAGFWARLIIRNRVKTIFTAYGWAFTEGASFLRRILFPFIEKSMARFSNKIICDSEYGKELAVKYKIANPDKLVVVHNGVEIDKMQNANLKSQNENEKCKIVFVGRLDEPKRPEFLLKAFSELSSEIKEKTEILIIGDGPKKESLISNFKFLNNVRFLGSLAREKVFEILRESDIFVLTSNWEGFPITILEAMSCGLPVIVSNVGGVSEVVDNSVGYLIKRADKEALKRALVQLIENPSLREKMGRNARKRIEDNFSLDKMLERTAQVYRDA